MRRFPLVQVLAVLVGSAIVLGLFLARGFTLHEHARILFGAAGLVALIGTAWALATAAERAGGWRRVGAANFVLIVVATFAAAFAPAWLLRALGY
jgi:hypothetical protein